MKITALLTRAALLQGVVCFLDHPRKSILCDFVEVVDESW
jgi:hypothetical protein